MKERKTSIQPISPQQVAELQGNRLPGRAVKAINDLLIKNAHNGVARIYKNEIRRELSDANIERFDIVEKHTLSLEEIKRRYLPAGWNVKLEDKKEEFVNQAYIFKALK